MDLAKKIMESMIGKLPNMDSMVQGYEFKDGVMKAQVDYKMHGDTDINIANGAILLHASDDVFVAPNSSVILLTDVSLSIKPPNMIFMCFLTDHRLIGGMTEVIFPNENYRVSFTVSAINRIFVKKGNILGYGIFVPYVPTNNVSFTKLNGTT